MHHFIPSTFFLCKTAGRKRKSFGASKKFLCFLHPDVFEKLDAALLLIYPHFTYPTFYILHRSLTILLVT